MIRYPLYVTIDTNIFDSTGYDLGDDGTLGHLYSYVQSGKIKIVLSNIVIREAQKHIKEKAYEIATLSKKLRDEIRSNKLYSDNFVIGIEMGHLIEKVNRNVLAEKAKANSNRDALLNFDNTRSYVKEYRIDSFSTLATLKGAKIKEHDELEQRTQTRSQKIARLKALAKAYSECEAYKAVAEESGSLSGLKKLKFDREHEQDLSLYRAKRKKLTALLNGEKITPKAWHLEYDMLIKEQQTDERSMSRKAVEIAFAQVLENNHKQSALMEENESHKQGRSIQRRNEQEV